MAIFIVMKVLPLLFLVLAGCSSSRFVAQNTDQTLNEMDTLPYASIPDYPDTYTANTVTARMIDGLGFRFYWATEGLREEDLSYSPDSTARTCQETLVHLMGLSETIVNGALGKPNIRPVPEQDYVFEEMRSKTLNNLKQAADILRNADEGILDANKIIFQRGDRTSEFPFWHHYNGPIADALWHCGQIVSFRRASGNPIDSRVNVFMGVLRER